MPKNDQNKWLMTATTRNSLGVAANWIPFFFSFFILSDKFLLVHVIEMSGIDISKSKIEDIYNFQQDL